MASKLSNYLSSEVLDWFRGVDMPAAPADVYMALWDGDPTADGLSGTEVTETIRVAGRVAVSLGAIASRAVPNDAEVNFGLSAGVCDITHAALFDAASGGNMLTYTPLDTPREIAAGDPVVIPIGDTNVNFN